MQITLNDVRQAAKAHGIQPLDALTRMQAVAAKQDDTDLLDKLCELKSELIGL